VSGQVEADGDDFGATDVEIESSTRQGLAVVARWRNAGRWRSRVARRGPESVYERATILIPDGRARCESGVVPAAVSAPRTSHSVVKDGRAMSIMDSLIVVEVRQHGIVANLPGRKGGEGGAKRPLRTPLLG